MANGSRLAGGVFAALFLSFVAGQALRIVETPVALDADGQLIRATNLAVRLRDGDTRLTDQIGTPSWGVPALQEVAEASPYPPGYGVFWVPTLLLSGGADVVLRAWSATLVGTGLLVSAWTAGLLGGPWAAVGTLAALVGMPVVQAMAGSCTIDTVLFPLGGLATWAIVRGDAFRRPGAGLSLGGVAAVALTVRWTAAPLLLPLAVAAVVCLVRFEPTRRRGVGGLVGITVLSAGAFGTAAGGLWSPASVTAWFPWVLILGPTALALGVWAHARRRGALPLARLALAVALVVGPALAWYWLRVDAVAFYLASQRHGAVPVTSWEAVVGVWRVLHQLGTGGELLFPLGLLAATRLPRRIEALALVGTGFLATWALLRTGTPEIFTSGSVGSRFLLGPAPMLAAGVGFLVAAAGRRAPLAAGVLVVSALFTQWSPRVPLCAPKPNDVAIYRLCGRLAPLLAWSAVPPKPGLAERVEDVIPGAPTPRIVAVLTPDRRLWRADEGPYTRALLGRNRAVTVVEAGPAEAAGWMRDWAGRVDDLVLVGLPGVLPPAPFVPGPPLDLGARAPDTRWYTRADPGAPEPLSDRPVGH